MQALEDCVGLVLTAQADSFAQEGRLAVVKLVVPNSAVSGLIGKGGNASRRLSMRTECLFSISPRIEGLKERIVMLSGEPQHLAEATIHVCRELRNNPHMQEHLHLKYDIALPLGAWAGERAQPADPSAPLMDLEGARGLTKRELVEYLKKAAPREILMRHGVMGNIQKVIKVKPLQALLDAVEETWDARRHETGGGWTSGSRELPAYSAEEDQDLEEYDEEQDEDQESFHPGGQEPVVLEMCAMSDALDQAGNGSYAEDFDEDQDSPIFVEAVIEEIPALGTWYPVAQPDSPPAETPPRVHAFGAETDSEPLWGSPQERGRHLISEESMLSSDESSCSDSDSEHPGPMRTAAATAGLRRGSHSMRTRSWEATPSTKQEEDCVSAGRRVHLHRPQQPMVLPAAVPKSMTRPRNRTCGLPGFSYRRCTAFTPWAAASASASQAGGERTPGPLDAAVGAAGEIWAAATAAVGSVTEWLTYDDEESDHSAHEEHPLPPTSEPSQDPSMWWRRCSDSRASAYARRGTVLQ